MRSLSSKDFSSQSEIDLNEIQNNLFRKKARAKTNSHSSRARDVTHHGRPRFPRAGLLPENLATLLGPARPSPLRPHFLEKRCFTTQPAVESHGQTRERRGTRRAMRDRLNRSADEWTRDGRNDAQNFTEMLRAGGKISEKSGEECV